MEEIFFSVVDHRIAAHGLRFKPDGAQASVYCFECKQVLVKAERQYIDELYESVLQVPRGSDAGRAARR